MITLVFTCRDREINTIERCLNSLLLQSNSDFEIVFVDYGSTINYNEKLNELLNNTKIKYIKCDVPKQLWNKSRAINIALKDCQNPFFFVGDIDMIFHSNFVQKLHENKDENAVSYFQVGFLDKNESERNCLFEDYKINFNSTADATGMTLYPTMLLKQINGFDEFYHGWGSEDTDVHIRLQNLQIKVKYYDDEILILHQWHQKFYRSLKNKAPFHTFLERINSKYLLQTKELKKTKSNLNNQWGIIPNEEEYRALTNPNVFISIKNEKDSIDALLRGSIFEIKDSILQVEIKKVKDEKKNKNFIKKIIGKKYQKYYDLEIINDLILETIISSFRNAPYEYCMDKNRIHLKIKL